MADVRLRPLCADDLPRLHRWYQDPALWDHLVGNWTPRTEAEAVAYMQRWLEPSDTELRLGIEVGPPEAARLAGLAFFWPLDLPGRWAELHVMLGEAAERGRGVGRQAVAELMARGFALGLGRIELKVLESNVAARRVYEACGFQLVGRDEPVVKGGRRVDVLLMQADQPRSATT